jgi:hypothetical protein
VIKAAFDCGSLATSVAKEAFIPIDVAPAHIILDHVHKSITDEGEYIWLQPFGEAFYDRMPTDDRGAWYALTRQFLWETLDEFWMCLAFLGDDLRLPIKTPYDAQRPQDCRYILLQLLNWWGEFEVLDHRFYDGILSPQPGYEWARATWDLLRAMGREDVIPQLREMDSVEAGAYLKKVAGY